ncbi:MAG: hypothetical protein ACLTW9_24885 [Enterocloster sp.]
MSDTFLTPWDSGLYGSRVTFLAGNAGPPRCRGCKTPAV